MIFCNNTIYGKVWEIKRKEEKYMDVQMTTSEKTKDGEYINSGWFPRIIGHAFNTLKDELKAGDRIIITKSKLSNERYTAKDGSTKSAFRFLIIEAKLDDGQPMNNTESSTNNGETHEEVIVEKEASSEDIPNAKDECPW